MSRWLKKYTEQQKEAFFVLLDKGGTVRAAARTVGVHEDAGYTWLRKTGLTMQRATARVYSAELKAEFLRLVRERQIISTVARELGIHKPPDYAWARKAGISTSEARKVNPRREEFLRLRAAGLTRAEARARVGADNRSATDWDKGITIISRGRVYPDGRIVRYPEQNTGKVPERRSRAIGASIDLNIVEKVIDSRYVSLLEREQLQDLRCAGLSIRRIAAETRRSPSTISRELSRNTISNREGVTGSTGRLGACGDNAAMKSFFALLQKNVLNKKRWQTRQELRLENVTWIERTYHRRRRQRGLGRLTPIKFEMIKPAAHAA